MCDVDQGIVKKYVCVWRESSQISSKSFHVFKAFPKLRNI